MQSNNYEWFITQTVEAMLPTWHDKGICLAMKIKMEWTDHGYNKDGNTKIRDTHSFIKEVLIIFHRPMNYTKVLYKDITKIQHFFIDKEPMDMQQLSDHDSCWRSDGMNWVFKTFVEAWDYFEKFGIEGRNIEPMFHYDIFNGHPSYRKIELEQKDKSDRWNTDYVVTIGDKIEMHEISKYMPNPEQ